MSAEGVIKLFQQIAKSPASEETDVILGDVISISPLIIKVGKLELTETFLILSALVKESTITIDSHIHTISGYPSTEPALTSIRLWRGLEVGDVVYMIRCAFGQKYFVLQREGGIA